LSKRLRDVALTGEAELDQQGLELLVAVALQPQDPIKGRLVEFPVFDETRPNESFYRFAIEVLHGPVSYLSSLSIPHGQKGAFVDLGGEFGSK
jgi:hypothetical protein